MSIGISYSLTFLPKRLSGKESTCQFRRCRFDPWVGRSPGGGSGNHSSIVAWKIPWTEEPGGLQSMGFQRVRHDLATKCWYMVLLVSWELAYISQGFSWFVFYELIWFLHHLASLVHYSWKLVNINCFCVGNINMLWMGDRKISEMWLLHLLTSKYTICIFIFVDSWGNKGKILLSKLATWWHCVSTQMSLGEVLCSRVMLWKDSCWCRGSLWSVNPHHLLLSEQSEPQTLSLFQLRNPEHFNSKISYKMKHLKVWYFSTALPIP